MSRSRLGSSAAAVKAQTRVYAERVDELVAQLRLEIGAPARPVGRPALVVLMGYPGVGKSHCARLLAARLGAAHVASDQLRSRLFIAPTYADDENATIFRCVDALVEGMLREGHRVIVDATNLVARYREASVGAAGRTGAPIVFIRVTAAEAAIRGRLAQRRTARAADDHSDADERVYQRMRDRPFEPPAEGHLELVNDDDLDRAIERIAVDVERRCASET
ncbi:MAG: ATP-binding protein [Chloroflexota bacterium]